MSHAANDDGWCYIRRDPETADVEPGSGNVWAVTADAVVKIDPSGKELARAKLKARTSQAGIAAYRRHTSCPLAAAAYLPAGFAAPEASFRRALPSRYVLNASGLPGGANSNLIATVPPAPLV